MYCRWMLRADLPAIVHIEDETGGSWTGDEFLDCLRPRTRIAMVVEAELPVVGRCVLGFAVYEIRDGELVVLNMACLTPAARRMMLDKLNVKAEACQRVLAWGA